MEKTGDFREGESRSDFDMTKTAKVEDGFWVYESIQELSEEEAKRIRPDFFKKENK